MRGLPGARTSTEDRSLTPISRAIFRTLFQAQADINSGNATFVKKSPLAIPLSDRYGDRVS
jgi:hypothetical protein